MADLWELFSLSSILCKFDMIKYIIYFDIKVFWAIFFETKFVSISQVIY
jgi:hypothetical protein